MLNGSIPSENEERKEAHRKIYDDLSTRGNHGTMARLALFNKNKFKIGDMWMKTKLELMAKHELVNEKYNKMDREAYVVYQKNTG